jgi:hypothetical protein
MCLGGPTAATTLDLAPKQDNTLIETPVGNSNGAGDGIFVGRVGLNGGSTKRRGMIEFDVSAIPAGSTINSVTLTLEMEQSHDGINRGITLHRANNSWGEAGSIGAGSGAAAQTSDATWLFRFYNTQAWATPGGDFAAGASAFQLVGDIGTYTWNDTGMATDVQSWVDVPTSNFGWELIGDESTNYTVKKFYSREGFVPPKLSIDFTSTAGVPPGPVAGAVWFAEPWPAPATGRVNLSYTLPRAANVSLSIHDAMGRVVRRLEAGSAEPSGRRETVWDGRTDAGAPAAPGLYLARLVVDHIAFERRIALLR